MNFELYILQRLVCGAGKLSHLGAVTAQFGNNADQE